MMMHTTNRIQLGVLGADDSLAIIQEVAKTYEELELIPIVYWEEDEIPDRIAPYLSRAQMWLFSGQVPYSIARQQLQVDRPMFYTRHSGEGLYKALLYWVHERGLKVSDISFDTLSPDVVAAFLADVGISSTVHLKHYNGVIRSEELVNYHKSLWEEGVTRASITCLRSAHLQLEKLGLPTMHLTPTHSEVRQVLENIIQTHELLQSRDAQVVVQLIGMNPDQIATLATDCDATVQRYARYVHGSTQKVSASQWMVYATRGAIEEITHNFSRRPTLPFLADIEAQITVGIGIGTTVLAAEERAHFALNEASTLGLGQWVCVLENNQVISPLSSGEETLSYPLSHGDYEDLSHAISLSALTLTKLASVLDKRGSTRLTAHELAKHLHILPRSARRILLTLEAHGLATVVGEETPINVADREKFTIFDCN